MRAHFILLAPVVISLSSCVVHTNQYTRAANSSLTRWETNRDQTPVYQLDNRHYAAISRTVYSPSSRLFSQFPKSTSCLPFSSPDSFSLPAAAATPQLAFVQLPENSPIPPSQDALAKLLSDSPTCIPAPDFLARNPSLVFGSSPQDNPQSPLPTSIRVASDLSEAKPKPNSLTLNSEFPQFAANSQDPSRLVVFTRENPDFLVNSLSTAQALALDLPATLALNTLNPAYILLHYLKPQDEE